MSRTAKVVETGSGKYGILAEYEIGNSGEYAQRMLVTGVSKKKATELRDKWVAEGSGSAKPKTMKSKGKGWHGESQRHSDAGRKR